MVVKNRRCGLHVCVVRAVFHSYRSVTTFLRVMRGKLSS